MDKCIKETEVDNEFYSSKIKASGEYDKNGNLVDGLVTETRKYKHKIYDMDETTLVLKKQIVAGKELDTINFSVGYISYEGTAKETPESNLAITPILGKMICDKNPLMLIYEGKFAGAFLTDGTIKRENSGEQETKYVSNGKGQPNTKVRFQSGNVFSGICERSEGKIILKKGRYENKATNTIYNGEFENNTIFNGTVFNQTENCNATFFYENGKLIKVIDKFVNGKVYSGKLDENMRRTEGVTFFPDGVVLDCTDSETYTCSNAKLTHETAESKVIYYGDIVQGKKQGKGRMEVYVPSRNTQGDNFCSFEGEFDKDKFVKGKIIKTDPDEKIVEIEVNVKYENNVCSGTIVVFGEDKYEYVGELNENLVPNGKGVSKEAEETYEGEFVMGQRHGNGKLTLLSGQVIEGEWENDEPKNVKSID